MHIHRVFFGDWIEGFEAVVNARQINKELKESEYESEEDKDKCALLFHYVGQQTRNVLKKLEDTGCEDEDYKKIGVRFYLGSKAAPSRPMDGLLSERKVRATHNVHGCESVCA